MTYLPHSNDKIHSLSVLFIDTHVHHYHHLLKGLAIDIPAHVLSPDRDGFEQICETLNLYGQCASVSTVYIVAHGAPGCLCIGDSELSLSTLDHYAQELAELFAASDAIAPKICLYGCCVAAGDAGEEFIFKLAEMTGAEIMASSNPVGHLSLGGTWHLDKRISGDAVVKHETTGSLQPPCSTCSDDIFSAEIKSNWFGILNKSINDNPDIAAHNSESIPLVFAGQPTTLNGRPIEHKSVIHNADVIRISEVATTFDGTVIDGVIRAVDTGIGMAYEPDRGELSCHSGSELLDGLLRVNLQFVKTTTDIEVHLPNLTAQFWDVDAVDEKETAEVVGFSNADSVDLLGFLPDSGSPESGLSESGLSESDLSESGFDAHRLEESGQFNNDKLRYRLRRDVAIQNTPTSTNCVSSNWNKEDFNNDCTTDRTHLNRDHSAGRDSSGADRDRDGGSSYRVTAQFKPFTSTDIAYGITQSLCATAVVCGLRLNALTITRSADYVYQSYGEKRRGEDSTVEDSIDQNHPDRDHLTIGKCKNLSARLQITPSESLSILFIDPDIQDYGKLLTSVKPGVLVHALNKREDGVEQITQTLRDRYQGHPVQSIYIASHSSPGTLYLGTGELSLWTLDRYQHLIENWQANSVHLYTRNGHTEEAGGALVAALESLLKTPVIALANPMRHSFAEARATTASALNQKSLGLYSNRLPFSQKLRSEEKRVVGSLKTR